MFVGTVSVSIMVLPILLPAVLTLYFYPLINVLDISRALKLAWDML